MTGFGRGETQQNGVSVTVELRSLNHRYLDFDIRLPKSVAGMEPDIRELINKRLTRGRISVSVNMRGERLADAALKVDTQLAAKYVEILKRLKDELDVDGTIQIDKVLTLPDVITFEEPDELDEATRTAITAATTQAVDELIAMRQREGLEIKNDLVQRVGNIDKIIAAIEARSAEKSQEIYQKLVDRVMEIACTSEQVDQQRLEMEIALMVEKMDVTEECIRFKSHNTIFLELLEQADPQGRRLNFLLQEMHREANTIGAKASDADIAHWVVDIKDEVEKLREQIQNIE